VDHAVVCHHLAVPGRGELTDKAWAVIEPLLPEPGRGRWRDHRQVINGSCGSSAPGRRGGTCPGGTGRGRPAMSDCGGGRLTGPGTRSSRKPRSPTTGSRSSGPPRDRRAVRPGRPPRRPAGEPLKKEPRRLPEPLMTRKFWSGRRDSRSRESPLAADALASLSVDDGMDDDARGTVEQVAGWLDESSRLSAGTGVFPLLWTPNYAAS
jgi:hypothetical protein